MCICRHCSSRWQQSSSCAWGLGGAHGDWTHSVCSLTCGAAASWWEHCQGLTMAESDLIMQSLALTSDMLFALSEQLRQKHLRQSTGLALLAIVVVATCPLIECFLSTMCQWDLPTHLVHETTLAQPCNSKSVLCMFVDGIYVTLMCNTLELKARLLVQVRRLACAVSRMPDVGTWISWPWVMALYVMHTPVHPVVSFIQQDSASRWEI